MHKCPYAYPYLTAVLGHQECRTRGVFVARGQVAGHFRCQGGGPPPPPWPHFRQFAPPLPTRSGQAPSHVPSGPRATCHYSCGSGVVLIGFCLSCLLLCRCLVLGNWSRQRPFPLPSPSLRPPWPAPSLSARWRSLVWVGGWGLAPLPSFWAPRPGAVWAV